MPSGPERRSTVKYSALTGQGRRRVRSAIQARVRPLDSDFGSRSKEGVEEAERSALLAGVTAMHRK